MRPRADHPILDLPLTHVIARIVSLRHLDKPRGAHFGKGQEVVDAGDGSKTYEVMATRAARLP
jgi:hypothetical protein